MTYQIITDATADLNWERIYSRGEDIALCMTIKKELTADAPDLLIIIRLHPCDTADAVGLITGP